MRIADRDINKHTTGITINIIFQNFVQFWVIETNIKLRIFMIQNYLLADMALDKHLFKAFFCSKFQFLIWITFQSLKKIKCLLFDIFTYIFFNYFSSISMTTVFLVIIIHRNGNFILIDKYTMFWLIFFCNLQMNI